MATKQRKRRLPRSITVILVILIAGTAAAGILFAIRHLSSSSGTGEATYTVTQEIVKNVIEISGTIEAAQSQTLQAAGDGTVTAVYVEEGDTVKKGQILLELETTEQEYAIAKLDYTIAQTKINGSSKDLELLELERKSLVTKLENRRITAAFDGVLAEFSASVGDYLLAQDSVGTLIERSYLKSYVEVVETDAPKLMPGQIVHCTFPAYENGTIDGYIFSYPAVGSVTNRGASVVNVQIRIDDPPEIILPNYSFTGEIEISPPENLILVEREAIGRENGETFVERILRDGSTERIAVTVEPYGATHVNITSGNINPGDTLKAQSAPRVSGTRQNANTPESTSNRGTQNPAGIPMGGPAGGMPPMR